MKNLNLLHPMLPALLALIMLLPACQSEPAGPSRYPEAKPLTRWWWFADIIEKEDIADQLRWLDRNGFGGVEIAWVYPLNRMEGDTINRTPRTEWLSEEWTAMVQYTKSLADSLGLAVDFTFGSLWPFGDLQVPPELSTRVFGEPEFRQWIRASWDYPEQGLVLDHLNREAFESYAARMGSALEPAMRTGAPSGIFVDSWEVDTRGIWTKTFAKTFEQTFGYDITPFMEQDILSEGLEGPRYDYMKHVSELIITNFFEPFTETAHQLGGFSRGQASGSPTDILKAYGSLDVPESEAMLYEPIFTRIVSSAAALYNKPVVTAETFTCLYGWPREHLREEQVEDLKLVADALFAHGLNQVVWHGMPYNPAGSDSVSFYASVHVGKAGKLQPHIQRFNAYLTAVSQTMRRGRPHTDAAIYLPLEDAWIAGEMPEEIQYPWAWGEYELRYLDIPEELRGRQPLWVNQDVLSQMEVVDGRMISPNGLSFNSLFVDVHYLDKHSLSTIVHLAELGLPVILPTEPRQAGHIPDPEYAEMVEKLGRLAFTGDLESLGPPLVAGDSLPYFWSRTEGSDQYIFFAHPEARNFVYPVRIGQWQDARPIEQVVQIHTGNRAVPYTLRFEQAGSVLLKVSADGRITQLELPQWKQAD